MSHYISVEDRRFVRVEEAGRRLQRIGALKKGLTRSLAGWLHAAAVWTARAARRAESRRRRWESAREPATAADDLTWREVREVLDAELAALSEGSR